MKNFLESVQCYWKQYDDNSSRKIIVIFNTRSQLREINQEKEDTYLFVNFSVMKQTFNNRVHEVEGGKGFCL